MTTEYVDRLPDNLTAGTKGVMAVAVKTEKGYTLTREFGFTVEEENGHVLAFDFLEHPDLGIAVLFGSQVFALKFWTDADLHKGTEIFTKAATAELERRKSLEPQTTA
jgi:hypothetical protein